MAKRSSAGPDVAAHIVLDLNARRASAPVEREVDIPPDVSSYVIRLDVRDARRGDAARTT